MNPIFVNKGYRKPDTIPNTFYTALEGWQDKRKDGRERTRKEKMEGRKEGKEEGRRDGRTEGWKERCVCICMHAVVCVTVKRSRRLWACWVLLQITSFLHIFPKTKQKIFFFGSLVWIT